MASVNTQVAVLNTLRRTLPWGVLGGLFSILYASDAHWTRYVLAIAVCHFAGILPTPPLFKFVYKIYCSESIGYNLIRPRLHPRFPASHSEFFPAVRSLRKGNNFVCNSQKQLSEEVRRLAECSVKRSGENGDVLIMPIPVMSDNYAYALLYPNEILSQNTTPNELSINCALIDAADPHRIILELERQLILAGSAEAGTVEVFSDEASGSLEPQKRNMSTLIVGEAMKIKLHITHTLTTHKHWDHAGGNKELQEMAQQFSRTDNKETFDLIEPALRTNLVNKLNNIEEERRTTERRRKRILLKNTPKDKLPLDPVTLQPVKVEDSSDDDEGRIVSGVKTEQKKTEQKKGGKQKDHDSVFNNFMAESDANKARGLISFAANLPFVGSKTDNPHCTNQFVANLDNISLGDVATITVLDAPGHTCGSVMFMLSLNENLEKGLFEEETRSEKMSGETSAQMAHSIHRALFTGDCIFCGGCGAMFETKSAEETLRTYDCFTGSTLTAFPIKKRLLDATSSAPSPEGPLFYVSSKNVMLFVGHEYTDRLFSDLVGMVTKSKEKLIAESEAVAKKEREERRRRGETEELKEDYKKDISTAALDEFLQTSGEEGKSSQKKDPLTKPIKKLPLRPHHAAIEQRWEQICEMRAKYHPNAATVPSTLYDERRTNPLLTLERSVLTKLVALNAHASVIEQEVYGSDERRAKL